jgi:hypothetical protein
MQALHFGRLLPADRHFGFSMPNPDSPKGAPIYAMRASQPSMQPTFEVTIYRVPTAEQVTCRPIATAKCQFPTGQVPTVEMVHNRFRSESEQAEVQEDLVRVARDALTLAHAYRDINSHSLDQFNMIG